MQSAASGGWWENLGCWTVLATSSPRRAFMRDMLSLTLAYVKTEKEENTSLLRKVPAL